MRRSALAAALTALAVVGPAAPALAHPTVALDPTLPFDVTYSATDNVEYLGRFPEHAGTAGGYPSEDGKLFYLTDPRGVHIYDTTDPASPTLLGSVAVFQQQTGVALAQEDPDTNGEILLVDGSPTPVGPAQLQVVDVSDPRSPRILSSLPVTDHTWTCVTGVDATGAENGCAYAYGRTGHVVDLTDPANPRLLPETWRAAVGYGNRSNSPYTHDLTEIRPGLVMSAGVTAVLMETSDPTAPVLLNELGDRGRFSSLGYHSVEWARGGADRFVVLGTEIAPAAVPGLPAVADNTAGSDCEGENSVIEVWDARAVVDALKRYAVTGDPEPVRAAQFTRTDAFDASGRGLFLTGDAPGSQLYCAHWMELHPRFKKGGLMAVAYYNRGTRFVDVDRHGQMSEIGWFTPAEGYAGSPQWISNDVVYVMDYRRGLEIVRLKAGPATKVVSRAPDLIAPASAVQVPFLHVHTRELVLGGSALLLVLLVAVERLARRRTALSAA
jgi:hypothetical protein